MVLGLGGDAQEIRSDSKKLICQGGGKSRAAQGSPHLRAANCGSSFAVAGTTDIGEIVLEPNTSERCRADHRWVLDRAGKLQDLTKNDFMMPLYTLGSQ
jgi:hypothetical protein